MNFGERLYFAHTLNKNSAIKKAAEKTKKPEDPNYTFKPEINASSQKYNRGFTESYEQTLINTKLEGTIKIQTQQTKKDLEDV